MKMKSTFKITDESDDDSDDAFLSAEEIQDDSDSEELRSMESDASNDADAIDEELDNDDNENSDEASDADDVSEEAVSDADDANGDDGRDVDSDNSGNDEHQINHDDNSNINAQQSVSREKDSDDDSDESDSEMDEKDADDEDSNNDSESGDEVSDNEDVNSGWADAMSKILKTNKPQKKKTLVLSRAKKITDVKKVKKGDIGFEIVDNDSKEGIELDESIKVEEDDDGEPKSKKRREELPNLRVKPNILEKGREKILSKIATRGVVQLFNAVRKQQKDIESKIDKEGPLERKKEKVIKSLDKHKFLDMLMGQTKSELVNKELVKKETKKEVKDEEDSTWSVFREDFMSGAKMKDWDKKDKSENKVSDLSDSD